MNTLPKSRLPLAVLCMLIGLGFGYLFFFRKEPVPVSAQPPTARQTNRAVTNASGSGSGTTNAAKGPDATNAPSGGSTNVAGLGTGTNAASGVATNAAARPGGAGPSGMPGGPGVGPGLPQPESGGSSTNEIQLSFQGANVDMVVQWLAKATGKSVIKHPRVQCQLTIVSSKKVSPREALNLVYRALALEGFNTIESSQSIFIVPDGQEPKMSPEFLDGKQEGIPEGRQRLIKVFPLKHIAPGELRDKVRPLLSEKATIDADDRANRIIVSDYNDNLRLLSELINELDVASVSETVVEIYPLKYSEAEELGNLLTLVLNAQAGSPSSRSGPGSGSPGSPMPMPGGGPTPGGGPMPSPPSSPPGGAGGAAGGAAQQFRIWPDKTANRLIVAAPKSKLAEVQKLIEVLDTDKPRDVTVRVIPLKHVSAEDLVKEIGPLYTKMSGKSLKDVIEVTFNNRSNSLIVMSSEANFKALEKLVAALDTEEAQEKMMRAFPLRNADAEDVAKQLQQLAQDQSASRYYYYFSPPQRGSKGISVVADRRRNTVIVQAPPSAMSGIEKMIKELDQPVGEQNLAPKIFPLKYVSAVDIEDVLNELFLKKTQQRNYWFFYDDYSPEVADRDVGRLYGKVRITSEPYSNSIIVTSNSPESLAAVEDILKQLDVPSQAGETTLRVGLKFAAAVTVATSINILFAKGGSPALRPAPQPGQPTGAPNPQQPTSISSSGFELEKEVKEEAYFPWLGGQPENYRSTDRNAVRPVSDLVGRVRVVPDRRSNSLMVTANVHLLPQVLKLINDLDAPTAQVLIEAKIIEVSSDLRDRLGVRWSPDGSRTFDPEDMDDSIKIRTGAAFREVFAGTAMADSLRSGVLDSSVNLDFLIQFLRKNTGSKVLAEPQINIADNELGRLFVGAQVPFIERSLSTDVGGLNQTFSYKDVGVILEVTPHINNAEEVALKIRAESSNIRSGETLFGGAILDTRNFRTDLLVKSGQTVVLGGIIQRQQVNTTRKVPLLGDIPVLGWAFKKRDKIDRDVELMVFLRPKVTRTPEDAKTLADEIGSKVPNLKQGQRELEKQKGAPKKD